MRCTFTCRAFTLRAESCDRCGSGRIQREPFRRVGAGRGLRRVAEPAGAPRALRHHRRQRCRAPVQPDLSRRRQSPLRSSRTIASASSRTHARRRCSRTPDLGRRIPPSYGSGWVSTAAPISPIRDALHYTQEFSVRRCLPAALHGRDVHRPDRRRFHRRSLLRHTGRHPLAGRLRDPAGIRHAGARRAAPAASSSSTSAHTAASLASQGRPVAECASKRQPWCHSGPRGGCASCPTRRLRWRACRAAGAMYRRRTAHSALPLGHGPLRQWRVLRWWHVWDRAPAEARALLEAADLVIVHNGKVEPRTRGASRQAARDMAHNYAWNVDLQFVHRGLSGVVVGITRPRCRNSPDGAVCPTRCRCGTRTSAGAEARRPHLLHTFGPPRRLPVNHRLHWHGKGLHTHHARAPPPPGLPGPLETTERGQVVTKSARDEAPRAHRHRRMRDRQLSPQ